MLLPLSFAERIEAYSIKDPKTGCWNWQKRVDKQGYGHMRADTIWWLAHRAAYTYLVGPIPKGLDLDHLCRNPRCVNPAHLEPVTRLEHARRSLRARQTHCWRGHEFTERNTYRGSRGHLGRTCRKCNAIRTAEKKARRRAKS